ncbi:HtaA domain-containing protein [Canibacter sp. lx-72]|uniref:HtaA domain-containing protein n=1 Tax=Canibacter zhuwentaonis TaxID=2837491 RepID=UPI001BDBDACB|nr:HtaA domain-containing protein [Canibacter zhuwentaonis]MBT1018402.1 HtaA domain-containing protein [Canibacter zhuwentaonis]MBT1018747.1 HtaA domain-containing protein [Canibacter zhuwentaonis]
MRIRNCLAVTAVVLAGALGVAPASADSLQRPGGVVPATTVAGAGIFVVAGASDGSGAAEARTGASATNVRSAEVGVYARQTECAISGGVIKWGVRESFRSYISGSIANGEWNTSEGADYQTPNFIFSNGSGTVTDGNAEAKFPGKVHFTGHDGVLDLTISNPTVEILNAEEGVLYADLRSNDTEGKVAVDIEQIKLAAIDLRGALKAEADTLVLEQAKVTLTEAGAAGFGGFYTAGEALDPLNMTAAVAGCGKSLIGEAAPAAATPEKAQQPATTEAKDTASAEMPWTPIAIGGVALLIIGVSAGVLLSRKKPAETSAGE